MKPISKIAIVGSGGRLGSALARAYADEFEVIGITRAQADLANHDLLEKSLMATDFDLLINCAALTNVDYCETHKDEAMRVNADAVRVMAEVAARKNARLIQISTDYVFDGEKREPYLESDAAHPISVYGESKLRGEEAALAVSEENLVVRVSWVFGPDRPSFLDVILKRAQNESSVEAVADKVSAPTYTLDAAEALRSLLANPDATGVLHLCNSGVCSWREYGQFALDCAVASGVSLMTNEVREIRLADLKNFVAKRPVNTVLATSRLAKLNGQPMRSWKEAVAAYVKNQYGR